MALGCQIGRRREFYPRGQLWNRLRVVRDKWKYFADPLCIICLGAYVLNRFVIRPHWHRSWLLGPFIHDHLNDSLLVPVALPIFLAVYRALSVRNHDRPPTLTEVLGHSLLWSLYFEVFAPVFLKYSTADFWDAVSYFVGGLIAWLIWNRREMWMFPKRETDLRTQNMES